jgi:hypothetical protein
MGSLCFLPDQSQSSPLVVNTVIYCVLLIDSLVVWCKNLEAQNNVTSGIADACVVITVFVFLNNIINTYKSVDVCGM